MTSLFDLDLNVDISSNSVLVLVVTTLVVVVYWMIIRITSPNDQKHLPPGPWKLPLMGNLHQLALAGSLPHRALRDMTKAHGPIMHINLGQVPTVVISSAQLAQEVWKTQDTAFLGRGSLLAIDILFYNRSTIIFSPCNDFWKQMRKMCVLELLSAKRVHSFAYIRQEEASLLVDSIYSSSTSPSHQIINLSEMIFSMLNNITARAAFGKICSNKLEFMSLMKQGAKLGTGFALPDLFPSLTFLRYATSTQSDIKQIHQKMDKILGAIIDDHKHKRNTDVDQVEDLVDVLLRAHESGELPFDLTIDNIKSIILEMYASGSDTSSVVIEWAMAELLKNPETMEKAQAEMQQVVGGKKKIEESDIKKLDYLKMVIKETLRLHPPFPLIPREATRACKVRDYDIPCGTRVLVNAWAIGRDPKYWGDNADSFVPERFQNSCVDFRGTDFELVPFGAGRRICPGISFATANAELALFHLLYFFNWELPNELDMTESLGINVRIKNELNVDIAIPFIAK